MYNTLPLHLEPRFYNIYTEQTDLRLDFRWDFGSPVQQDMPLQVALMGSWHGFPTFSYIQFLQQALFLSLPTQQEHRPTVNRCSDRYNSQPRRDIFHNMFHHQYITLKCIDFAATRGRSTCTAFEVVACSRIYSRGRCGDGPARGRTPLPPPPASSHTPYCSSP